ncbi:MAG: TIGR03032 family protein, partial [Gammaproteobacteria bacterium]|nr:TIGR03032 family protein [Gammaproteobacteria bacterium]
DAATASASDAGTEGQTARAAEIRCEHSPELPGLLQRLGVSLLISTYQAGKVIVVRGDGEKIDFQLKDADKPMGIAAMEGLLAVGVAGEIRLYGDIKENCRKVQPPADYDACFVERINHLTGGIDIHEMAFGSDRRLWFINTRFCALCTLDQTTSFVPVWRPPYVSSYAPEDRCHLNGLGMFNGRPRFVTALGESDKPAGWRERKADGGVLIDLSTGKTLCRGLSMPHSPRWYADQLWICESGQGTLAKVETKAGTVKTIYEFPGFTRGLDFYDRYAFVGLSQIRETTTFGGLPIAEKVKERNCGVWIVDIVTGELAGVVFFTQGVQEIFAVQVLPGIRYPEILNKKDPLALETYILPPEVLPEVRETPRSPAAATDSQRPDQGDRATVQDAPETTSRGSA